ncbi:MAG: beta-eliminating lyase-related protein [Pseudomonadota bacterium]
MDFSSDTSAPAHPSVIDALSRVNSGMEGSYGNDSVTARVRTLLADTFETDDFDFLICASGTASNALALSLVCPPTGSILCHEEAHIERDERGAPEFFTGGGKLSLLPGEAARIDETALKDALAGIQRDFVHETPPHVLSLTNLTESGATYSVEQIDHYTDLSHARDLSVHLDGARLGNALASTGANPAEMSWKAGVDVLTLGLTKTGAMGCEIILLFGDIRAKLAELHARAKRSGHMPPKMRYLAAQAEALLTDGLWLDLSARANTQATRLADVLTALPGTSLRYPVEGNEVFVSLPDHVAQKLETSGAKFYPWPGNCYRFVCAWSTTNEEIEALASALATA